MFLSQTRYGLVVSWASHALRDLLFCRGCSVGVGVLRLLLILVVCETLSIFCLGIWLDHCVQHHMRLWWLCDWAVCTLSETWVMRNELWSGRESRSSMRIYPVKLVMEYCPIKMTCMPRWWMITAIILLSTSGWGCEYHEAYRWDIWYDTIWYDVDKPMHWGLGAGLWYEYRIER